MLAVITAAPASSPGPSVIALPSQISLLGIFALCTAAIAIGGIEVNAAFSAVLI